MTRSPEEIERICKKLINGYRHEKALEVTIDEFQHFYTTFVDLTKTTPVVSLVGLDNIVVAQFSNLSPQHFDIVQNEPIDKEQFGFIKEKHWYGSKRPPEKFWKFTWLEFRQNLWKLIVIFLISVIILFLTNDSNFYDLVAGFLVQSSTVFLSLYIIFTVSQSQTLYKDILLFKNGTLHRYYSDDRNVTLLGILTIALTFLSIGIVHLLSMLESKFVELALISGRSIKAIIMGITITMLFDTFLTVANYYLERNRDVLDRDMVADVLDEDYRRFSEVSQ